MANGGPPSPPKKSTAITPEEALRQMLGSSLPSFRLTTEAQEAIAKFVHAVPLSIPSTPTALGSGLSPSTEPNQLSSSQSTGAIAGGGGEDKRKRGPGARNKQGRASLHGGDRTVKFYKPTEAELDMLGELSKDESAAWSRMYFCLGVLANVVVGLLFASGLSEAARDMGDVIAVGSLALGMRFWRDAFLKGKAGTSALEKIKDSHDFGTI